MVYKVFSLILAFTYSSYAFSFNYDKCKRGLVSTKGKGIYTTIFTGIMNTTYSVGQSLTSTGGCAAIGMTKEEQAQVFYAFNHEKVLEDIAKGGGEYYSSLSRLWGCPYKLDRSLIQQKYMSLNQLKLEDQYSVVKGFSGCSDGLGKN